MGFSLGNTAAPLKVIIQGAVQWCLSLKKLWSGYTLPERDPMQQTSPLRIPATEFNHRMRFAIGLVRYLVDATNWATERTMVYTSTGTVIPDWWNSYHWNTPALYWAPTNLTSLVETATWGRKGSAASTWEIQQVTEALHELGYYSEEEEIKPGEVFWPIYPFEDLARGKRYEAMNVATGKVAERWWDYAGKRWGSTVVRIAQNENIYKLVLDLMRVSKAKQLPGVTEEADAFNLGYIRQELTFYAKALQSELFTDYTEQQVWAAIHCAVIAWMVLEQRRAYWNLLGELTDFVALPCEQNEIGVTVIPGTLTPIRYTVEGPSGTQIKVSYLADYADLLWEKGDIYVMTEAVQGIDWLPLKNVIRFYRYYYQAYLKEVREADIVNTVVMTVWYIGLGYVVAGNLGQLLGPERTGKLLKYAKDTGGWIYNQVKRLVGPMADTLLDAYLKSLQPTIPTTPIVPPKEEEEKKDNTALIVGAIAALLVLGKE